MERFSTRIDDTSRTTNEGFGVIMKKISAILGSRNDNYGGNLNERATWCLNSLVNSFDEVWLIDWNSPEGKNPLLYDIKENICFQGNLNHIVVTPKIARVLTRYDEHAQVFCEVLARNLGLRRATGDWLVSTNIDVICPKREDLEQFVEDADKETFYTISRRGVDRDFAAGWGFDQWEELRDHLYETVPPREYGEKIADGDDYSLINCCGDFQIAHKDIWNEIRGFEEDLIYSLYTDTNVQKKAVDHGFDLKAVYEPPLFHIDHGPGGGGFMNGTNKKCNNPKHAIGREGTQNRETWGFNDINVEWETI